MIRDMLSLIAAVFYGIAYGAFDSIQGFFMLHNIDKKKTKPPNKQTAPECVLAKRRAAKRKNLLKECPIQEEKDEPTILSKIRTVYTLNGVLYCASYFIFYSYLIPNLGEYLISLENSSYVNIKVWYLVGPITILLFQGLWVAPLIVITKVVSAYWFQGLWLAFLIVIKKVMGAVWSEEIADLLFRRNLGEPRAFSSLSILVADGCMALIIELIFLWQTNAVCFLPMNWVYQIIYIIHLSLLNSLYCFEYKWINMAMPLDTRLRYIEEHWPYFLGFGLPLAFAAWWATSYVLSCCLYAVLFPFFLISATAAVPVENKRVPPLRLFAGCVWISNTISKCLFKGKEKKSDEQPQSARSR